MRIARLAASVAFAASLLASLPATAAEPEDTMIITLKDGEVVIGLRPDLAPQHVERIKTLVREGAYDNVAFHRVIGDFMAQTGDVRYGDMEDGFEPQMAGRGGSELGNLPAEFSEEPFERGIVGMARGPQPDTANSQFFIMFDRAEDLDRQYTVVGEVESGMEFVDNIKKGVRELNGAVQDPDRMLSVRIAADAN